MIKRVTPIAAAFFCLLIVPDLHALEEVGVDDFRISRMGVDGVPSTGILLFNHAAQRIQAVAYNSQDNEYLVVYAGDTDDDPPADDEIEVFGQRIDGTSGDAIGGQLRLTTAGTDFDLAVFARSPAIAYDRQRNEYLLAFESNAGNNREIWVQRLAADGTRLGNETQISGFADLDGDTAGVGCYSPSVAYNPNTDDYLVVWQSGATDGLMEIYGRLVNGADGQPHAAENFRISDMGPDGNESYFARFPAVAVNTRANEYLVVWEGQDDQAPNDVSENEIFAQRLDENGAEIGVNDFPVSDMGALGSTDTNAHSPRVAYNPLDNQYLVVWEGNEEEPVDVCNDGCMDIKYEIYGQRLTAAGAETGDDDFRIGTWDNPPIPGSPARRVPFAAPVTDPFADAVMPDVAFDVGAQIYAVVWNQGDYRSDFESPGQPGEIFAQSISRTGVRNLPENLPISAVGFDGVETAYLPNVAARAGTGEFLVVFGGRGQYPLDLNENETYGQRLSAPVVNGDLPPLPPPPVVGPNPFRPNQSPVSVKNAGANGRVQVYDFAGEKIRELIADGAGDVQWDGRNDAGEIVATGTYFLHFDVGDRIVKVGIQN